MIPVFKKIRKKMADDNRPIKYLRYATGEVILVVIGILIALQINNWNEDRKAVIYQNNILQVIQSDLEEDIIVIDGLLAIMEPKEKYFLKIANKTMTREDYKNCKECDRIISGFPDISLQKRGFNLLLENVQFKNDKEDQLLKSIHLFYSYYNTEIGVDITEVTHLFNVNYDYWINKEYEWVGDFLLSIKNEKFIDYTFSSGDYRNRVINFYTSFYLNYIQHLKGYRKEAKVLIEQIDQKLKK